MEGRRLDGIKVVLDAANGANACPRPARRCPTWGPSVIGAVTAPRTAININAGCGSLHPQEMMRRVTCWSTAPQIGLAFDGDADRVILADEKGRHGGRRPRDAAHRAATWRPSAARLTGNTVVGTIMSNMGLELALREVAAFPCCGPPWATATSREAMRRGGYVVGGEKSGHLILGHLTTTGDGLLTALQVLKVMGETGQPALRPGRPDDRIPAGPARRPRHATGPPGGPTTEIQARHRAGRRPPGRPAAA